MKALEVVGVTPLMGHYALSATFTSVYFSVDLSHTSHASGVSFFWIRSGRQGDWAPMFAHVFAVAVALLIGSGARSQTAYEHEGYSPGMSTEAARRNAVKNGQSLIPFLKQEKIPGRNFYTVAPSDDGTQLFVCDGLVRSVSYSASGGLHDFVKSVADYEQRYGKGYHNHMQMPSGDHVLSTLAITFRKSNPAGSVEVTLVQNGPKQHIKYSYNIDACGI